MRRRYAAALCAALLGLVAAPAAHSAPILGIGDQQAGMFDTAAFKALPKIKIVRYIAPYDTMKGGLADDRAAASAFLARAKRNGSRILVAFYHSRKSPNSLPSVSKYTSAVKAFRKKFPYVKDYQPWNETNRGDVPGLFHSPNAKQSAAYYKALKKNCSGCTLTGLDLLDAQNFKPSLKYLKSFQKAVRPASPKIWGLHNYSDTNRNSSTRTKAFLKAVKGDVWLTETGGIVKFGRAFPGGAKGEARAAKAIKFMYKIAKSNSRIKRLYVFQWTGSGSGARFDAGLTESDGATPRPGYNAFKALFK